jgi:glycerol-3-phosphate cytidylyltransferase
MIPYAQRAEIIENIKCVDKVIPEENWEQKVTDVYANNPGHRLNITLRDFIHH